MWKSHGSSRVKGAGGIEGNPSQGPGLHQKKPCAKRRALKGTKTTILVTSGEASEKVLPIVTPSPWQACWTLPLIVYSFNQPGHPLVIATIKLAPLNHPILRHSNECVHTDAVFYITRYKCRHSTYMEYLKSSNESKFIGQDHSHPHPYNHTQIHT